MDAAPGPVESTERALSSEPYSTRPNPFDDSDQSSRKRRRTSLSGASTSRSHESPAADDESAMKIETDPTTPQNPELLDEQPAAAVVRPPLTAEHSSRVTINVRTPSRRQDNAHLSPTSPETLVSTATNANAMLPDEDEEVKISVEDSGDEAALQDGVDGNTPQTITSDSDGPSFVALDPEPAHDNSLDSNREAILTSHGLRDRILVDPLSTFPYCDKEEACAESVSQLTQFLPTHEGVGNELAKWVERSLVYFQATPRDEMHRSIQRHFDFWVQVPELVTSMLARKSSYPMGKHWQEIMSFYSAFAQLASFFLRYDLGQLSAHRAAGSQPPLPHLVSLSYISALASLSRREEILLYNGHLHNGDQLCDFAAEIGHILRDFSAPLASQGGPVRYLEELAQCLLKAAPQFSQIAEALASTSVLVDNILYEHYRRASRTGEEVDVLRAYIARGHQFFQLVEAALVSTLDKHINQLNYEFASALVGSLTSIYRMCLRTERIVSPIIFEDYRRNYTALPLLLVPDAISQRWKFTIFTKLIMSSQMQLRVMAVSSMCTDLVAVWRKYSEGTDEEGRMFVRSTSDFLLQSGLVSYILSPTCHPEITLESSNIIGFLAVSRTYTNEHTDALWQTVTSTQDPRVSDALMRMISRIAHLFSPEGLIYLCEKLNTVAVESFGPTMRDLFDVILKNLTHRNGSEQAVLAPAPFDLCIRLLRLSSASGQHTLAAYHDTQHFALVKFRELLTFGPSPETRQAIYKDCIDDITAQSETALGSLCVLSHVLKPYQSRRADLHSLAEEHDLTRILVAELESATQSARKSGASAVFSGSRNAPRKELLTSILYHEPSSITKDIGFKLWDLLVGSGAACQEDRDVAWQLFNGSLKNSLSRADNPFLSTCYSQYLPTLAPDCFCPGALEFVREGILPSVNDPTSIVLDDPESPEWAGIEQLWRMVLTAPKRTIENQAISTLVHDIYIDSGSILSFPHYRARDVHLKLVRRCLSQLARAAANLKALNDGTASGEDDSMVIVATDEQIQEQELLFIRSLAVLREFHRLHEARAQFSAPDLQSLILEPRSATHGEHAELKYQSFDGNTQTGVLPLDIGKHNTAGNLLATLREVTGFTNYRVYYKGRPFAPRETEIFQSLEELDIHTGILLVKREPDLPLSPKVRTRPGVSPVEVEILNHFDALWEYLSLDGKLAQEIYTFLIKLPVDENIMHAIRDESVSYLTIVPIGQPLKSLYGLHAVQDFLRSNRASTTTLEGTTAGEHANGVADVHSTSLVRAMSIIAAAILDPQVVGQCPSEELQVELSAYLVQGLASLLGEPSLPITSLECLDAKFLDRMVSILAILTSEHGNTELGARNIYLCIQSMLVACSLSGKFFEAFRQNSAFPGVLGNILLEDKRVKLRHGIAFLILDKIEPLTRDASGNLSRASEEAPSNRAIVTSPAEFQSFFWPLVCELIAAATTSPAFCGELFDLGLNLFKILRATESPILQLEETVATWCEALLAYTTFEEITQDEPLDGVAFGLTNLLHCALCWENLRPDQSMLAKGLARKLFWKHLFPPFDGGEGRGSSSTVKHHPILNGKTRSMMIDIIFALIGDDRRQLTLLVCDLCDLVPFDNDDEGEFYAYELPLQFDRTKAVRASCGYAGLKNLSNTCYLNSLFTQLFMNVEFRRFMLNTTVLDREEEQNLVFQTQNLFGNMQESLRRFMNPEDCVFAIKTYEDGHIDIHNQMDVDEFYNLLFDRWEAQLHGAEAKKVFRSFYGGQLVQQVSSKECEHISERLEPFSAIQCDIKGKTCLEESLQAYVDGEIMAGDNKYKCSTCDRHVDAVKRACLKDIPDNLIFHLKRFDFNLRTLQRSKINDHFAFPHRIDMRPYTIGYLSDAQEVEEDIFELVGVLVHSGTAESGHYYSYIRERPSSSASPTWIEFNDDVVSQWDPNQMENSCFGGVDHRGAYENGMPFDKNFSAYMLFYQRASSLAKQQELLLPGAKGPVKVRIPEELRAHIQHENTSILRRHCLYDPAQIPMVRSALTRACGLSGSYCSGSHKLEDHAIDMALGHLDQVAARAKDFPDFVNLINVLMSMVRRCWQCSASFVNYFAARPPAFRWLVQRSPEHVVRQGTVDVFMQALKVIRRDDPHAYGVTPDEEVFEDVDEIDQSRTVYNVLDIVRHLFEKFEFHTRSWPETFGFMLSFLNLGREEVSAFLQTGMVQKLLLIISADPNLDIPTQFIKLANIVARRMATRPPSYEHIIGMLNVLLSSLGFMAPNRPECGLDRAEQRLEMAEDEGGDGLLYFTRAETRILLGEWERGQANIFLEKLISLDQNVPDTDSIVLTLMSRSPLMEERVYRTLRGNISGQITQGNNSPFLRVAALFCEKSREADLVHALLKYISHECSCLQNGEGRAFFEFQRRIFEGAQHDSPALAMEAFVARLQYVPEWAPGLLGYFDSFVSKGVVDFLHRHIFRYTPNPPEPADDNGTSARFMAAVRAACRSLGIQCLSYLRDNYMQRRIDVSARLLEPLDRVIKQCAEYFDAQDVVEDSMTAEFYTLTQSVLDPLTAMAVADDVDEDGSAWDNSSNMSEQAESLGDMVVPADADVP